MKDTPFENEMQELFQAYEASPPDQVWNKIIWKLRFPGLLSLSVWLVLITAALFSLSFFNQEDNKKLKAQNPHPNRIILLIDTSYCKDGSFRIDTVFQDLPPVEPKPEIQLNENPANEWNFIPAFEATPDINIDTLLQVNTDQYKRGEEIFNKNCASCHAKSLEFDTTGPALKGVTEKYDKEWLYAFTKNSQKMIDEEDTRALKVWEDWQPALMPPNPSLQDQDLDDLYYFVGIKSKLVGD